MAVSLNAPSSQPLTSIGPAAAREEQHLVPRLPTRIEVETGLRQSAHDEHGVVDVVVLARCDDVPALSVGRPAVGDLDRGQVGTKIARKFVNEKAFPVRRLPSPLADKDPPEKRRTAEHVP